MLTALRARSVRLLHALVVWALALAPIASRAAAPEPPADLYGALFGSAWTVCHGGGSQSAPDQDLGGAHSCCDLCCLTHASAGLPPPTPAALAPPEGGVTRVAFRADQTAGDASRRRGCAEARAPPAPDPV